MLQLRTKDMKAVLEYPKEEEREEVDLTDLIQDRHIALSKLLFHTVYARIFITACTFPSL